MNAGMQSIPWYVTDFATGIYFIRIEANDHLESYWGEPLL